MESTEYFCKKRNPMKKIIFGLLVVTAGALMLAFNLGAIDESYRHIVFSWKMLLVAIGLINLFDKHSYRLGIILISVGVFFLLPSFIPSLGYNFTQLFWPALIIIAGILILTKRHKPHYHHFHKYCEGAVNNEPGYINKVNVFSGSNSIVTEPEFKGGEIVNVFGGCKLDLTNTKLAPGRQVLEIECVFGGVSILAPSDWVIQIEVNSVMGGFQDRRSVVRKETADDTVLVIKGNTVFGGGEIK